jgi:MFS family permease
VLGFLRDNAPFLTAGVLLTFASSFGQTYFISVFAGQIQGSFGLDHGSWGALYGAATMASALAMVWAGTSTDHFRVRTLGPVALIGLALACLGMSLAQGWLQLALLIFALRFFGQGMLSHIALVAMARWYVARRGRALSIAGLGYAGGEALLPITMVAAMGVTDWRSLWIVAALLLLAFVPIIRSLLKLERTPETASASDETTGMGAQHWTRAEAMRHPLFWFMVPAVIGPSAFITALFFQQVHLAQVKGWSHLELVSAFPVYTVTSIGAMLLTGQMLDRFGTGRLVSYSHLPLACGFFTLWATTDMTGALAAFLLIGFGHGAYSTLFSAFWAEFYGTRYLGSIRSLTTALMVLGSAIGPGITGAGIRLGVSFPEQTLAIGGWFVISSALMAIGIARTGSLRPA